MEPITKKQVFKLAIWTISTPLVVSLLAQFFHIAIRFMRMAVAGTPH